MLDDYHWLRDQAHWIGPYPLENGEETYETLLTDVQHNSHGMHALFSLLRRPFSLNTHSRVANNTLILSAADMKTLGIGSHIEAVHGDGDAKHTKKHLKKERHRDKEHKHPKPERTRVLTGHGEGKGGRPKGSSRQY